MSTTLEALELEIHYWYISYIRTTLILNRLDDAFLLCEIRILPPASTNERAVIRATTSPAYLKFPLMIASIEILSFKTFKIGLFFS
jgi:hypothetical protein